MIRLIIISCLLIGNIGFSQTNDAELWTGLSVKAKLVKNLYADVSVQTRFNNNFAQYKTSFFETGINYNLVKNFDIGLIYRLSRKNIIPNFITVNRISFVSSYQFKIKKAGLRFNIRAKYQHSFDRLKVINESILPREKSIYRLKLKMTYKIKAAKRISPYIACEIFYAPKSDLYTPFETTRFLGGLNYTLNKRSSLRFKYLLEHNKGQYSEFVHIYSIGYRYKIKGKLFKK